MNWRHFDLEVRFQFVLNREGHGTTELYQCAVSASMLEYGTLVHLARSNDG